MSVKRKTKEVYYCSECDYKIDHLLIEKCKKCGNKTENFYSVFETTYY